MWNVGNGSKLRRLDGEKGFWKQTRRQSNGVLKQSSHRLNNLPGHHFPSHSYFYSPCLQNVANIVFVILFTVELLLKIFALGLGLYLHSLFNRFDLFVVVTSLMEVLWKYPTNYSFDCQGDFDRIGSGSTTWALGSSLCPPSQSVQGDKVR